jgi:serine/threonine protein phosphatase PrpC
MRFLSAAHTDVGIKKKVNQDAFCLKIATATSKNIAFAVLCDGMGGLKMGELASSFLVNAFSEWFETVFPQTITDYFDTEKIQKQWNDIILKQNELIKDYGQKQGFSLGTTLTTLLICDDSYITAHVGDSRLYKISNDFTQITKDHTLVALEVEQNKITAEQAKTDKRKNILLQCVGASNSVVPDFQIGRASENDVFMLCSDGFRHEISEEEFYGVLAPEILTSETIIKKSLVDLVNLNKSRGENDNITSIVIKCIK